VIAYYTIVRRTRGKKMNLKVGRTTSALLILVGLLLLGVGTAYPPLATVIYATPTLNINLISFPSGTQAAPTLLKGGALYTLEAYLTVLDVSVTVKQVTITGTGYSLVVTLTYAHTVNYDKIYSTWTAPVLPDGTILTFLWHVEATGAAGIVYKADAYSYGKIGGPVGKFYINGQEANIDSVFTVSSPTLTFSFKATAQGDLITSAWIKISCTNPVVDQIITLAETTADTEWTGTFTLPSRGTYTILGYISYGGNSYRLMSLLSNFGETPTLPQVNTLQIIGGLMLIAGVAVEVLRKRNVEVSRKGRRLSK
jgi:hypothetical protein